jgi:hypothetical protein
MPKATVNKNPERFELKTVEGGFVTLRQLSYGEWLERQDILFSATMEQGEKGDAKMGLQLVNAAVARFEFGNSIVDHNLFADDEEKVKLDFKTNGITLLDPRIGAEIGAKINQLHEFDEGNSEGASAPASS